MGSDPWYVDRCRGWDVLDDFNEFDRLGSGRDRGGTGKKGHVWCYFREWSKGEEDGGLVGVIEEHISGHYTHIV